MACALVFVCVSICSYVPMCAKHASKSQSSCGMSFLIASTLYAKAKYL